MEKEEKDHRGHGRHFGGEAIVEEIKMLEVTEKTMGIRRRRRRKQEKGTHQKKKIRIPSKRTTRKKTQDLCQTASYRRKHRTLQPRLGLVSCKHIPMKVENITNSV